MFCKSCGATMPEGAGFCPACGGKTQSLSNTPVEHEHPQQSNPPYQPPGYPANPAGQVPGYPPPYGQPPYQSGAAQANSDNKKKLIIIIVVAAALLIAAGILLAVLLSGKKAADISGTWEGTISLDESDGDPELRDTDVDLIGKTANVTVIFDMDDDGEGLAELYIDDDPNQMVKLDAAVKGKTVTLSGRMYGNATEVSGKIIEENDDLELFAEGTLTGRNGSMTMELDIEQTSSRKNRPEGSGDERPTVETTESSEPFTNETTETEPTTSEPVETTAPVETTNDGAVETTSAPDTFSPEIYYDSPDQMAGYLTGEWISEIFPDGTHNVLIFYSNATVDWLMASPGQDTSPEGYRSGNWMTEFVSEGQYAINGNQLKIIWYDIEGFPEDQDITLIDENQMILTLYFDEEAYDEFYERVDLR